MAFAILGTISAAIAEGATAALVGAGLGTAATATAVGTGGVGLLSAGTTAALASGIGAIGTGALVGAGLGAAGSAIAGEDPGEGAAMGALGGAATGGLGSAFGGGAGAATGSTGTAVLDPMFGIAPNAGSSTGGLGSTLGNLGTDVAKSALPTVIQGAGSMLSPGTGGFGGSSMADTTAQNYVENRDARQLSQQQYGRPLGGGKLGSRFAEGGELNLEDGQFILPADVVSALGNGSTKAGAQFLDEFFGLS